MLDAYRHNRVRSAAISLFVLIAISFTLLPVQGQVISPEKDTALLEPAFQALLADLPALDEAHVGALTAVDGGLIPEVDPAALDSLSRLSSGGSLLADEMITLAHVTVAPAVSAGRDPAELGSPAAEWMRMINMGPTLADRLAPIYAAMFNDPNMGRVRNMFGTCVFNVNSPECRGTSRATYGSAIGSVYTGDFGTNLYRQVGAGTGNQFYGQVPSPWEWRNIQQADAIFNQTINSPTIRGVLGYNPNSSLNFGAQFLANYNNYVAAPWTNPRLTYSGRGMFAAASMQSPAADIETRYQLIAHMQLNLYFHNNDLSKLRSESNTVAFAVLFADPTYVALTYALNQRLLAIAQDTISFPLLVTTASEMASWTKATSDPEVLRYRSTMRLLYTYLTAYFAAEMTAAIKADPDLTKTFQDAYAALEQIEIQNRTGSQVTQWDRDWSTRWQRVLSTAQEQQRVTDTVNQLVADYPQLNEYMRLNSEVVAMQDRFKNHPELQNLDSMARTVLSSPQVSSYISSQYNDYRSQVNKLVNGTSFSNSIEQHSGDTTALIVADPLYKDLATAQSMLASYSVTYQQQVYAAVINCINRFGSQCDPNRDPAVVALVTSPQTIKFFQLMGTFYDLVNRYWYLFYTGTSYQQLEQRSADRTLDVLEPVMPTIDEARAEFNDAIESYAPISRLRVATLKTGQVLSTHQSTSATSGDADFPVAELQQRLQRMAQLEAELQSGQLLYLPLLRR